MKNFRITALITIFFMLVINISCSSDDNGGNPQDDGNNDNNDGYVTAASRVISGKLQIRKADGYEYVYTDWTRGACDINLYFGVNTPDGKIGEGTINADGSFQFTLPAKVSDDNLTDALLPYGGLDISPANLQVNLVPLQAYAVYEKDGETLERHIDIIIPIESEDTYYSNKFFLEFYSADGHIKGMENDRELDMIFDKGWNISNYNYINDTRTITKSLPQDAIFYCY